MHLREKRRTNMAVEIKTLTLSKVKNSIIYWNLKEYIKVHLILCMSSDALLLISASINSEECRIFLSILDTCSQLYYKSGIYIIKNPAD